MMLFDNLALFDLNPIHIGFVLLLALLLFGPQKLPEIGKQLGSALRELKRAGSSLADSFNTDHEPETHYNSHANSYADSYGGYDNSVSRTPAINAYTDLSDYTIAGKPPADLYNSYETQTITESSASGWDDYGFASTATAVSGAESKQEGSSNV